jgi:hypothetical protein
LHGGIEDKRVYSSWAADCEIIKELDPTPENSLAIELDNAVLALKQLDNVWKAALAN